MIGALDQRITFQAYSTVSDGQGGETKAWANLASVPTVWAFVKNLSGGESGVDGGEAATSRFLFTIRNRSDLDEKARIKWGGESYNIKHIRRRGSRNMYLEIEAERGGPS